MGGTLLDSGGTPTWGVPTLGNQRCDIPKCMEHRTSKEVLPVALSFLFSLAFTRPLQAPGRRWEDDGRYVSRCQCAQELLVVLKAPLCE
jgi:hypothetical protein